MQFFKICLLALSPMGGLAAAAEPDSASEWKPVPDSAYERPAAPADLAPPAITPVSVQAPIVATPPLEPIPERMPAPVKAPSQPITASSPFNPVAPNLPLTDMEGKLWEDLAPELPAHWQLMGGAGLYVMQAYFDNNMAFGASGTAGRSTGAIPPGSPGVRLVQRIDIDHQMTAAPHLWLGFATEGGYGARVGFWHFREGTLQAIGGGGSGTNATTLTSASPLGLGLLNGTSSMVATSKLQIEVWDVEALYKFQAAGWSAMLSGGGRLARIDQAYNAFVPQSSNNTVLSSSIFSGAGPTLALELRRPIGKSCINIYGGARYSLVFGDAHQQAANPDQNLFAQEDRHIAIGIAEAELGLEYRRAVGRSQMFGQIGVVGQNWSGAGSASRSSVNVVPSGGFVGAAYSGESDFNLLGLAIRLGVDY